MTGHLRAFSLLLFALLFIAFPGCDCTDSGGVTYTTPCARDSQCASGERCISGYCAADPDAQDVGTDDIGSKDAKDGPPDGQDPGEDVGHDEDTGDNSDSGDDDCPHRLTCEDLEAECGLHPD